MCVIFIHIWQWTRDIYAGAGVGAGESDLVSKPEQSLDESNVVQRCRIHRGHLRPGLPNAVFGGPVWLFDSVPFGMVVGAYGVPSACWCTWNFVMHLP